MKKKAVIIISVFAAVLLATVVMLYSLSSQDDMTVKNPGNPVCMLPITRNPIHVEFAPGLSFKFDTGSDITTVTKADLEVLKKYGSKVEKSYYPTIGRNGNGKMRVTGVRYKVSFPVCEYKFHTDSTGNFISESTGKIVNRISDVDVILSETGESVLGIDFIERFFIEFLYNENALALHTRMPEGYQKITDIVADRMWFMSPGWRYYISLRINNINEDFFIDTGIRNAGIKMPMADSGSSTEQLTDTTMYSAKGAFPAKIDWHSWLVFGDRAGSYPVTYFDNSEEGYSINPLNMFDQDIVLDFRGKGLWLRPSAVSRRAPVVENIVY
jgi:hypothetical protein